MMAQPTTQGQGEGTSLPPMFSGDIPGIAAVIQPKINTRISSRISLSKRLKEASISPTKHLKENINSAEPKFSFKPSLTFRTEALAKMAESWAKVVEIFALNYAKVYLQTSTKKKAHLDCVEAQPNETTHLIHEPKRRWCPIVFLDALVRCANDWAFSPLLESAVTRRKFNQHLEFKKAILEVFFYAPLPIESLSRESGGVVTPEMWESDLPQDTMPSGRALSISPYSHITRAPPLTAHEASPPIIDGEVLWESSSTSDEPSDLSLKADEVQTSKKRKNCGDFECAVEDEEFDEEIFRGDIRELADSYTVLENVGSSSVPPIPDLKGLSLMKSIPWESHEALLEYLLTLAGSDRTTKKFLHIAHDLCNNLSSRCVDKCMENPTYCGDFPAGSLPPCRCPVSPLSLSDVIANVVAKIVTSNIDQCASASDANMHVGGPLSDYYDDDIERDLKRSKMIKSEPVGAEVEVDDAPCFLKVEPIDSVDFMVVSADIVYGGHGQYGHYGQFDGMRDVNVEHLASVCGTCASAVEENTLSSLSIIPLQDSGRNEVRTNEATEDPYNIYGEDEAPSQSDAKPYLSQTSQESTYSTYSITELWDEYKETNGTQ